MPSETEREARERREGARLAFVEEVGFTDVSVGAWQAGAEYEAPIARQAERARIEEALWRWHANEVDSDGEETWASSLIRDIIEMLQPAGAHTEEE